MSIDPKRETALTLFSICLAVFLVYLLIQGNPSHTGRVVLCGGLVVIGVGLWPASNVADRPTSLFVPMDPAEREIEALVRDLCDQIVNYRYVPPEELSLLPDCEPWNGEMHDLSDVIDQVFPAENQ
jgi:hypothetical protein